MPSVSGFAFGPFQLDVRTKRLTRDGLPVDLQPRHFALLHALLERPSEVVTKEDLMAAAWPGVIVTDNRLAQVISEVRGLLDATDSARYIRTVSRRGYSIVADVTPVDIRPSGVDYHALVAPFRGLIDGRAALETLALARIVEARALFSDLLVHHSNDGALNVGMANACVLIYESTRAQAEPNREALRLAEFHAREAIRLLPNSGEACATLGFVLERTGDRATALAMLRRAVALEPVTWQHRVRHSYASWGGERLTAAYEALSLLPGCVMAHCLAATVFIGRNMLERAEREIDLGLASADVDAGPAARFSIVAVHWLKGLLLFARGAVDEARASFERELALEARGHFYARECCANTWYAVGACELQRGNRDAARAGFDEALSRVPTHTMARAGLALIDRRGDTGVDVPVSLQSALNRAAALVAAGRASDAADVVKTMLALAPPGDAGWLLPVDPLLGVQRERGVWTTVLATLSARAS